MTKREQGLMKVQELYVLQSQLINLLDQDLTEPRTRKVAKKQTQEFESLLKGADWRYMGGEDVYEEMKKLPGEISVKLKTRKQEGKKKKEDPRPTR